MAGGRRNNSGMQTNMASRQDRMTRCAGDGGSGSRDCSSRMRRLQQLDFMIQEVVLYLDSYPDCKEALHFYHHLLAERRQLADEYEEMCGPLTANGNQSRDGWDWVKSPWPWQISFPGNGGSRGGGCGNRRM